MGRSHGPRGRPAGRGSRLRALWLGLLLSGLLGLLGCEPAGNSGTLTAPAPPRRTLEAEAITNLVALYREAVLAEDIDRVQRLLLPAELASPGAVPAPAGTGASANAAPLASLAAWRQTLSTTFRTRTVTALTVQELAIAADRTHVTFLEAASTLDPATLAQQTRVSRTTFQLARQESDAGVSLRIWHSPRGASSPQVPLCNEEAREAMLS